MDNALRAELASRPEFKNRELFADSYAGILLDAHSQTFQVVRANDGWKPTQAAPLSRLSHSSTQVHSLADAIAACMFYQNSHDYFALLKRSYECRGLDLPVDLKSSEPTTLG